jgi:hypothetical protein
MKMLRWIFLCACILLAANPAWTQNQPKLKSGPTPVYVTHHNVSYQVVSFDDLFFNYAPPVDVEHPDGNITKASKTPMAIPEAIKALNGKKVAIKGFVIPLANAGNDTTTKEFLFADELVSCLFCAMLGYDQWMIGNTVNPKGFDIKDDQFDEPITIYGTIEVGPKFEDGEFEGIYRIKAESFEVERKKILGIF